MLKTNKIFVLLYFFVCLKIVNSTKFTFYWIAVEDDYSGTPDTWVMNCNGQSISLVSYQYAVDVRMEGTGKLKDGRVINLGCDCGNGFACFIILDENQTPWGLGSQNNPLIPYISVASNDIPFGSKVYIPSINGWSLPGTTIRHNGCVRVDDTCWSCGNNHVDFFVTRKSNYEYITSNYGYFEQVSIQIQECQILDYNYGQENTITYSWNTVPWSTCSESCGGGIMTRSVTCTSSTGGIVADLYCNSISKPSTQQTCNVEPCIEYSWNTGPWSTCSESCGGGIMTRSVTCTSSTGGIVADLYCNSISKPSTQQTCNVEPCIEYSWNTGPWSTCSDDCIMTRSVTCTSSTGGIVAESYCASKIKPSMQKECETCNTNTPIFYYWSIDSSWSTCSESCGVGIMTRSVTCTSSTSGIVADLYCNKPSTQQTCNVEPCIEYSWNTGPWSTCSDDCIMTRSVTCTSSTGGIVVESYCASKIKPSMQKECETCNTNTPIFYYWSIGSWSTCSESCGVGIMTRSVTCTSSTGDNVADTYCNINKPPTQQACYNIPCKVILPDLSFSKI